MKIYKRNVWFISFLLLFVLIILNFSCKKNNIVNYYDFTYTGKLERGSVLSFTSTSPASSIYYWNFGDGSHSSEANPTHSYSSAGSFLVTLRINNSNAFIQIVLAIIVPGSEYIHLMTGTRQYHCWWKNGINYSDTTTHYFNDTLSVSLYNDTTILIDNYFVLPLDKFSAIDSTMKFECYEIQGGSLIRYEVLTYFIKNDSISYLNQLNNQGGGIETWYNTF